jgi:hydrogenase maturation protease
MTRTDTLVIACGNPLRGDDALGPAAAEIVASWQVPGVKVCVVHQLVPELIEEMKQVQRVYFLDAAHSRFEGGFHVGIVEPRKSSRNFDHHESAANLLALLQHLEGAAPTAWLVSITAIAFEYGAPISDEAQNHLHAALDWMRANWTSRVPQISGSHVG